LGLYLLCCDVCILFYKHPFDPASAAFACVIQRLESWLVLRFFAGTRLPRLFQNFQKLDALHLFLFRTDGGVEFESLKW